MPSSTTLQEAAEKLAPRVKAGLRRWSADTFSTTWPSSASLRAG